MANSNKRKWDAIQRINIVLNASYAEAFNNMARYTKVHCRACYSNFFLEDISEAPEISQGVISDAHGEVRGYQFRFSCPHCKTLLRVDEDEIEFRVWADPDKEHS